MPYTVECGCAVRNINHTIIIEIMIKMKRLVYVLSFNSHPVVCFGRIGRCT